MRYSPDGKWLLVGRYWIRLSDGFRLPAIQGGGAANTVQNAAWAFGDDDGNEAAHTLDSESTARTAQAPDVTFTIRFQPEETGGGTENKTYFLYAQKNGAGGFNEVPTSPTNDGLRISPNVSSRVDDENTTERISYGGGSGWQTGKFDDGSVALGTSAISLDQDSLGYTDVEFCILIDSANASDSDYWDLRVEFDGTDLDDYLGTLPRVTASILATPAPEISDGLTVGDSVATTPLVLAGVAPSDGITIGDVVDDISVTGGAEPDRNVTGVSDDVTIGDNIIARLEMFVSPSDDITVGDSPAITPLALSLSVSDGLTIGETTIASLPDALTMFVSDDIAIADEPDVQFPGVPIAIDLGVDNLSVWRQGVVIYD